MSAFRAGDQSEPFGQVGVRRAEFCREAVPKFLEVGANLGRFLLPVSRIHAKQFFHIFRRDIEAIERERAPRGNKSDRRFLGLAFPVYTLPNTLKHADIFALTRPQKLPVYPFAEPVPRTDPLR